jgi:hypothetical protein
MTLAHDIARCAGRIDADTGVPIALCLNCERWRNASNVGSHTPWISPPAYDIVSEYGLRVAVCDYIISWDIL